MLGIIKKWAEKEGMDGRKKKPEKCVRTKVEQKT